MVYLTSPYLLISINEDEALSYTKRDCSLIPYTPLSTPPHWNFALPHFFIYFLFPSTTLGHDAHGLKCSITSSIYNL